MLTVEEAMANNVGASTVWVVGASATFFYLAEGGAACFVGQKGNDGDSDEWETFAPSLFRTSSVGDDDDEEPPLSPLEVSSWERCDDRRRRYASGSSSRGIFPRENTPRWWKVTSCNSLKNLANRKDRRLYASACEVLYLFVTNTQFPIPWRCHARSPSFF